MKALRIVGSVLGAFLLPIIAIILCVSLALYSAASLITDKTIEKVVHDAMDNDVLQNTVSNALAGTLTDSLSATLGEQLSSEFTANDNALIKDVVSNLMEAPAVQEAISNIVKDTVGEVTSGEFDGEIDIGEKVTDVIVQNPEILNDVSKELTGTMLGNDTLRDVISSSEMTSSLFGSLDKETTDAILADPGVQDIFAEVVSQTISSALTGEPAKTVDVATSVGELIEEKPDLFRDAIDTYIPDEATKNTILYNATEKATEAGVTPPAADMTNNELVVYLLDLYKDEINTQFNAGLGGTLGGAGTENTDPDIDYTDYSDPENAPSSEAPAQNPSSGSSLTFDKETTDMINKISGALHFLRSAAFILAILLVFAFFYLLMSLFTWSFRYPLIFDGIAATLTGLMLVVIGSLPLVQMLPTSSEDELTEIVISLVTSVWNVLAGDLVLIGFLCIGVGILCIAGYVVWTILRKRKKTASEQDIVPAEEEALPA